MQMVKEDFKKGQEVFILKQGNAARNVPEDKLIEKWIISSVGRKFISASRVTKDIIRGEVIKFNIERDFIQETDYCIDYALFLTEEDAKREIWRGNTERKILNELTWRAIRDISDEDLKIIENIIDKTVKNHIGKQ